MRTLLPRPRSYSRACRRAARRRPPRVPRCCCEQVSSEVGPAAGACDAGRVVLAWLRALSRPVAARHCVRGVSEAASVAAARCAVGLWVGANSVQERAMPRNHAASTLEATPHAAVRASDERARRVQRRVHSARPKTTSFGHCQSAWCWRKQGHNCAPAPIACNYEECSPDRVEHAPVRFLQATIPTAAATWRPRPLATRSRTHHKLRRAGFMGRAPGCRDTAPVVVR